MSLTFISAGAGSGKTHKLMQVLGDALSKGDARPSGVMATTFTKKAAAELRERVREHLLSSGAFALANAMGQARIGTVNAVCGALLERFAFEAGMATKQQVLDEAQASQLVRESIDAATSSDDVSKLSAYAYRLGIEDWTQDLKELIAQVRSNNIQPDQLSGFAKANADGVLSHFPQPNRTTLTQDLLTAVARAMPDLQAARQTSTVKKTHEYVTLLEGFERQLRNGPTPWSRWPALAKEAPEKGLVPLAEPIQMLAQACDAHPDLHNDIRHYLECMFALCEQALVHYRQRKLDMGVVDFADQESLLLELLDQPAVSDVLRDELDLLLVDEFQDTSPIQLALFLKLSQLARHTYWVGDLKQAIYGFRGSDTELMQSVLRSLPVLGAKQEILSQSWRSRPSLVHLVNEVFTKTFAGSMPAHEIELSPQRPELTNAPALVNWSLEGKNVGEIAQSLAAGVRQLLDSGKQIPEKGTETLRPLRARDIAILCRSNDSVSLVAASLRGAGIFAATLQPGLLATPEAVLALACLRRLNDVSDTVATAEIIALADGSEPEVWLVDRLKYLAQEGKAHLWREQGPDAHPLLQLIAGLRAQLPLMSPLEALRRVVTMCELPKLVMGWQQDATAAQTKLANLDALLSLAAQYEEVCLSTRQAATLSGLLLWLNLQASEEADALAMPGVDAVRVLTQHAAKGLEWPVVVVTDLDSAIHSRLWGISAASLEAVDAMNPLADRFIRYWPWPFGKQSKGIAVKDRVDESPSAKAFDASAVAEAQRLLYVSMTRPREMLVMARKQKAKSQPLLECLGADWLTTWDAASSQLQLPNGMLIPVESLALSPEQAVAKQPVAEPLNWWPSALPSTKTAKSFNPSAATSENVKVVEQVRVGERLSVARDVEWDVLGTAIHACLAASFTDTGDDFIQNDTRRILQAFGMNTKVDAHSLAAQVSAIRDWILNRWPGCHPMAETPVVAKMPNGQQMVGRIDLLLAIDDGIVVLDHKSTPTGPSQWDALAQQYSGQLFSYAAGVEQATGRKVTETWLVFPVAGACISVSGV